VHYRLTGKSVACFVAPFPASQVGQCSLGGSRGRSRCAGSHPSDRCKLRNPSAVSHSLDEICLKGLRAAPKQMTSQVFATDVSTSRQALVRSSIRTARPVLFGLKTTELVHSVALTPRLSAAGIRGN